MLALASFTEANLSKEIYGFFFARVRGFESQVIWNLNFIPRNRVLWFSSDINEEQLWFELTNTDI